MTTSLHDDDEQFLRDALPAFISESVELLDQIEQLLLELESNPGDRELLDALFRCAHTIKGSAGLFGLDEIVAFTHHVETFLDALREGQVSLDAHSSRLLLSSGDQIRRLVNLISDAESPIADEREALIAGLIQAMGGSAAHAVAPTVGAHSTTRAGREGSQHAAGEHNAGMQDNPCPTAIRSRYTIHLVFGKDTFRDGFDPLAILEYLATIASIESVSPTLDRIPMLEQLDAEDCHLSLEVVLTTEQDQATLGQAFELFREDCEVQIERMADPALGTTPDTESQPHTSAAGSSDPSAVAAVGSEVGSPVSLATSPSGAASTERKPSSERRRTDEATFLKVRADRLDEVINLLGELVIAGAGTGLLAQRTGDSELIESAHQLGRLIEEIRNGTLQLRMVQIGETFGRFRRVVHDLAAELGKDVHLDIVGGETELDKSMVERINDPLMHLVRNALDHGLETREQRVAGGKPEQGTLRIAASHDAGGILISIQDDGRGINREKVLARARERGLVAPGVTPTEAEVFALIFEPGFSTAEAVTNLSGRGVGMDVVRRNIQSLRGRIDIHSIEGKGTTIEVRLPLTLAIIDGFLVNVADAKFIFPLETVVEVVENRRADQALDAHGCGAIELRGQVLPVVSLRTLYQLDAPESNRCSVVVIQSGAKRYGVLVDALLGQHQTVIKPLSRIFRSLRGMSGSSILGNGEVALIFDVNALALLAEQPPIRRLHSLERTSS